MRSPSPSSRAKARHANSRSTPFLQKVGEGAQNVWRSGVDFVTFVGEATLSVGRFATGRAKYLKSDLLQHIEEAGVNALPIVSLISLLIGMIFAFVGVTQLREFGAGIYTANLVAVAMIREMAPIMTAIILAGRTGAAYAAEIGTMKVNEEIDALTTLGINPMDFLVTPRMLALVLMIPALTLYSSLMGIIGGAIVGLSMIDASFVQYVQQTIVSVTLGSLFTGLADVRRLRCAGRTRRLPAGNGVRHQRDGGRAGDDTRGRDGYRAHRRGRIGAHHHLHQPGHLMDPSTGNAEAHIEVRDLTMAYGDFVIQQNLNFTVRRGDIFIIMGGSGCGKSTLLKIMIGLKSPSAGEVCYEGEGFWAAERTRQEELKRKFGTLFQAGALWSGMTLAENVALPLQQYTRLADAEIRELCAYKLALVGLAGFEDFYPSEISGGMKKRAGLARAMAMDPDILFFDEPSAGLDPISAKLLDDLILELRDSLGTTVVIVTHELSSIFSIGNNAVFLDPITKTQLATGDPKELRDHSPNFVVRNFLLRGTAEPVSSV